MKAKKICVVGAANVDIMATAFTPIVYEDSNPGEVCFCFGGVGRNIAAYLAQLGAEVELITVVGQDIYGSQLQKECLQQGISLAHSIVSQAEQTSTYLCINDSNGEMRVAVSAMEIYKHLTPSYLETKLEVINSASAVILDTNLTEEAIAFLATHVTAPLFIDPVSTKKAIKLKDYLGYFYAVKPNRIEANVLAGYAATKEVSLPQLLEKLLAAGAKKVFISLSEDGVFYGDGTRQEQLPCYTSQCVNTTGCGDAFMAAMIWAFLNDKDTENMARYGLAAAAICIEEKGAISHNLSEKHIEYKINGGKYNG